MTFTRDRYGTVRLDGRRITVSGLMAVIESLRSLRMSTDEPERRLRALRAFLGLA